MTIATDNSNLRGQGFHRVLITTDQYDRMIDSGIIENNNSIELLDSMLVAKDRSARGEDLISVGADHRWAVQTLSRALTEVRRMGCDFQTQQPVVLPPFGEPEPDAVIILESSDQYRGRQPCRTAFGDVHRTRAIAWTLYRYHSASAE